MDHRPDPACNSGATLVETLIATLLAGLILAAGIPAMSAMVAGNRIHTQINDLSADLQLARSEAIKRDRRAVLCPSSDGETCLGSHAWNQGYMVFIDTDEDRRHDRDEPVVHFHSIDPGTIQVDAGLRRTVTYRPTGWSAGSNLTVTFCDPEGRVAPKAVVVSMTGRPRISDSDPDGGPLSCG
jgi:type IV fimbrial biogenesis protein FimT